MAVPASMPDDLLDRAALLASTEPCQMQRHDLLALLERAGMGSSHAHDVIAAEPDGAVLIGRAGVLEALRLARTRDERQGGRKTGARR